MMIMRQIFVLAAIASVAAIAVIGQFWPAIYWAQIVLLPIIAMGLVDMFQTHSSLRRLYPVLAHFRYLLESVRP